MLVVLPFIAYICFIDLSSVSFLCTVLKVEEDMDEGVLCEREDPEKMPFLGKDQTKKDEKGADGLQDAFEELTEEVMLALVVMTKSRSISTVGGSEATCTRNFFELFFQNR